MKAEVPAFIWIYKSSNGITHDRERVSECIKCNHYIERPSHTWEYKIRRGDNYKTTSVLKWVTMIYNAQYPSKEIAHHFFSTSVQSVRNIFHKKLNLSYYHKYLSLVLLSLYNHIHHFIHIQHVAWIRNFFRKNKSTQIHVHNIIVSMAAWLPDFTSQLDDVYKHIKKL